jgi:hypothetical protein
VEVLIGCGILFFLITIMIPWKEEKLVYKYYEVSDGDRYTCKIQNPTPCLDEHGDNCCD